MRVFFLFGCEKCETFFLCQNHLCFGCDGIGSKNCVTYAHGWSINENLPVFGRARTEPECMMGWKNSDHLIKRYSDIWLKGLMACVEREYLSPDGNISIQHSYKNTHLSDDRGLLPSIFGFYSATSEQSIGYQV
jgi:hypothetical protein